MKPSPMSADLAAERGEVLHKALRGLPDDLLVALLRGVRKHADSLHPGSLSNADGGCAVGMMLHELRGTRPRRHFGWRSPTIHEEAPELAGKYPRLAHLEFIFDRMCEGLARCRGVAPCEVASTVGLWMADEVAAEINLRHMEQLAASGTPTEGAVIDDELFSDTVARVRTLRPMLSEKEAEDMVERVMGARKVEPLAVPAEWEAETTAPPKRVTEPA